ncbi:hypothetical protein SBI67_05400 [Mycolicibacterium sp. 120266]|uniref:hypothetical protein n=1 Tax=Mycolicibacterium sp. 120266 TaxID=3090601 RepID=UPI00299D1FDC|nr:hypothetical protein [Mycolicibacterium sp. 120266]MDX1871544.1 hypothetical protein [Mycolicibacterium sp. 120266]
MVIVPNAGTTDGYRAVRALLAAGHRVVATDRHATALVRLLPDSDADRLLLLAADTTDPDQWNRVLERATTRFGSAALPMSAWPRTGLVSAAQPDAVCRRASHVPLSA